MRKQLKLTVVLIMAGVSVFIGYASAYGSIRDLTFVDSRYKTFIIEFIDEMEENGIRIPRQQRWTIEEDILLYKVGLMGIAVGMNDDRQVNIRLSPRLRYMKDDAVRFTIWHELAHDVFNIKHGNGTLMKTSSSGNDDILFPMAKREFIEMLKRRQAK